MKSRNTRQKEILQTCVDAERGFFSASGLLEKATITDTSIGIATVYRFLKAEKETGNLYAYQCDGKTIYSTKNRSHCHYVCEETGEVIHFDIDNLDFLKDKIPGSIESFQIEVRGVCDTHRS
jgi:Fur family ferric uptake transcriptional regulator